MTTTLRPSEPERRFPDGTRSRTYDICVNSRVAGGVRLRTEREPAGSAPSPRFVGGMDLLSVEEGERRRGRATVAVLAGEEVLRGWGCYRVWVALPSYATGARQLAAALGYRETNRHMSKPVTAVPDPPPDTDTRPLTDAEFPQWRERAVSHFVETCVGQGLDRGFATAKCEADLAELLPRGPGSEGMALSVLLHRGHRVGTVWTELRDPAGGGGFVYDVSVDSAHRGRGHGRELMRVAERATLAAGGDRLSLNVFAENAPARGLYDSLGFEVILSHYHKPLV